MTEGPTVVVTGTDPLTFRVRSASRRELYHVVSWDAEESRFDCDCEAFTYRPWEACRHVVHIIRFAKDFQAAQQVLAS